MKVQNCPSRNRLTNRNNTAVAAFVPSFLAVVVVCTITVGDTMADGIWQLPGNGIWADASSWTGDVPNGVGQVARFDVSAPSSTASIRLEQQITLGGIQSDNSHRIRVVDIEDGEITFDAVDGVKASVTTGMNAGPLILDTEIVLADALSITPRDNGGEIQLNGAIRGSHNITKTGPGTLILGGDKSNWLGALTVVDGEVKVRRDASLSGARHTVLTNARLQLDSATNILVDLAGGSLIVNDANDSVTADVSVLGSGHLTTASTGD